jgi:hypothetical protein
MSTPLFINFDNSKLTKESLNYKNDKLLIAFDFDESNYFIYIIINKIIMFI